MGTSARGDAPKTILMRGSMEVMSSQQVTKILKYSTIKQKLSLSPSTYEDVTITNSNYKLLRNLISDNIKSGKEVGSDSYIHKSSRFFLRTKALQRDTFLLDITKESAVPIIPQSFVDQKLRKGMVLISKDSNIGEVGYLEKNYPEYMMSAGLIALEIPNDPFYVLSIMKSNIFRAQLNAMVPPGTIIKHAKKMFLDCKIPFPNNKILETIMLVEELTKAIIRRESEIHTKYKQISNIFEQELFNNCEHKDFSHYFPKYSELKNTLRLDTGIYEREYLSFINCIETYKGGCFKVPLDFIKGGNTPKNRIFGKGYKKWITPSIFGELGYLTADERIICEENNITKDCVIIKNRTLKEKLGRFVGTAVFYEFGKMGLGQHNQGCYRIEDYDSSKLKYIALVLNTQIYRKICGYVSHGSKMREIKSNQFASIPFPEIGDEIRKNLIGLYYKDIEMLNHRNVPIIEMEQFDLQNITQFGILQLASQLQFFQRKLSDVIGNIVDDKEIDFDLTSIVIP